jgi:hypothetical protein
MKRFFAFILLAVILLLVTSVAWALPTPVTIDGSPADWSDATCVVDTGGADDETSPARADISEFCAHVDSQYVYVAMTWDNTGFTGGNASTAGSRVDVDADGVFDYFILATMAGNPAAVSGYSIGLCDASGACTNSDGVCSSTGSGGGPCTGTLAASGALWTDPFGPAGRGGNVCGGANCTSFDAFAELAFPWALLGLAGPPSPHVFGDYGSYPSGPAQAPKDTAADGSGIACDPQGVCWISTPTAISLSALDLTAGGNPAPTAVLTGVLVLAAATFVVLASRRGRMAA